MTQKSVHYVVFPSKGVRWMRLLLLSIIEYLIKPDHGLATEQLSFRSYPDTIYR